MHDLGLALKMQGRFDEARELFDLAQKAVPQIRWPIATGHSFKDWAGWKMRSTVIARPSRATRWTSRPMAIQSPALRLGRDDELLSSFDEVAMMHPEVAALTVAKGDFLFRLKRYEEAIETYERAARLDQLHVTPHDGCLIHARIGNFEDAIHSHERA